MHSSDAQLLRSIFEQSILERSCEANFDDSKLEADHIDINELTEKIGLLPECMRSLLFMTYIFHMNPNEAETFLSIRYAKQKLAYVEMLLAYLLKLSETQWIAKTCMKKAVKAAFDQYILEHDADIRVQKPRYSNQFRKALKEIKSAQTYRSHLTLRRAATAILVAMISFALTTTASAKLRERIFSWLIETFPLFSRFSAADLLTSNELDFEKLRHMEINYIPNGFKLINSFEVDPMVVCNYEMHPEKCYILMQVYPQAPLCYWIRKALNCMK